MSEEVDFFASDQNDDDLFFDSSEVIIDNIQKVYISEDLAKTSDFFLPEGKENICLLNENRSSHELKLESKELEIDSPTNGFTIPTNEKVEEFNNVEENFAGANDSNVEINFDYDIAFRSHSYDEAKSCRQGLDEKIQPVVNPFLSYDKRVITSPVMNPFSSHSADKESDQGGIRPCGSNSYDGGHFDYDATFPSFGESKNSTKCSDDIIPPVVNPFIAYGRREITTPVINPFSPANDSNVSPLIAKVFYTVNEYSKIVFDETSAVRDSTPPQDVFSVCPPDSPDSPINASPNSSDVEGDMVPAEDVFIGLEKFNHSTIGGSARVDEFAVDSNDLDFDDIINNVSANLGNNFNRSSFSTFNSPSLIPEPVPVANNHFNESVAVESESSNIDNNDRARTIVPQSGTSRPSTVTSRSASNVLVSKILIAKTPQSAPKVVFQGLSAKKLNSLLTEMQVRLKVPPSEELTTMVSNFAAVSSDPKLTVVRTTNRLSSKNINLHNEIISQEEMSSSPESLSAIVEPTTELKEIKKGGKITKPSGYTSPISSRRDSDTFSVSSSRSARTRSSVGTAVSKQSTLSHSSKAVTTTSRLSAKSAPSGPSQLNKRLESSASSVCSTSKATVKSNGITPVKKTASPGSRYGQVSSTAVPVLSRNHAAVSPASFTSPAAPAPRNRPQSLDGTASKAISPTFSSATPRSTAALSTNKKTPSSDISVKRSKSSDGLLRSSNVKEAAAKSPAAIASPRSVDGKSDLKATRSQTVTPTSTLQRSKSLDKTQTVRKNISSDSISTWNSASVTKPVTPKRVPYTGTLYDPKSSKKATPVAEVVTVGAAAKSSPSLKCSSFDSLRSAKKNVSSSMTSRILAADDLQRARSCELSPSPIKGSRAVKEEKATAYAFPTSTSPQQEPMSVMTAEEMFSPPPEKKRTTEVSVPAEVGYEVGSANPMLSAKVPLKIATRERSDSRDSMASSASNQANSFLSIYSPASGSNILQVKRTKTPPVIRSATASSNRGGTSLDHTAIGEEYHLRAMNEAASTSTSSSTTRSSARRSSAILSKSTSSSDVFLSMPPPPRPRPDALVLVSPLPKKSLADISQYMPSLTHASHEMITMMFCNIDSSSKGGKIDTGIENESSQTNVLVETPLAMDVQPNQENFLLSML